MSSLRNAVQRRNHKERAQPLERMKWGVLEKHKDYSLRAKDYNEKKKRLKILRQKAAERNPDEFHFGMMSNKTRQGGQKVSDRGNKSLSHDAVKLLKTQDMGYLRTVAQQARKARGKLEREFVLRGDSGVQLRRKEQMEGKGQHLVFVDSLMEQESFPASYRIGTKPKELDEHVSSRRVEGPGSEVMIKPEDKERKAPISKAGRRHVETVSKDPKIFTTSRRKGGEEARQSKLSKMENQERELMIVEHELDLQRARMNNSIGGVNKAGVTWKVRERKK